MVLANLMLLYCQGLNYFVEEQIAGKISRQGKI